MLVPQHPAEVRAHVLIELAIVVEPPECMPREDDHGGASTPEPIEVLNGCLVIDGVAPILTVTLQERPIPKSRQGLASFPFLEIDQDEGFIVRHQRGKLVPPDAH